MNIYAGISLLFVIAGIVFILKSVSANESFRGWLRHWPGHWLLEKPALCTHADLFDEKLEEFDRSVGTMSLTW